MIFKTWRKAKWQHQDAKIRVEAIRELAQKGDCEPILLQILEDDPDLHVRKQALQAISSPALLLSVDTPRYPQPLAAIATSLIEAKLLGPSHGFDVAQRQQFYQRIRKDKSSSKFLLQWFKLEPELSFESDFAAIADHQGTLISLFQQTSFCDVQCVIIDKICDEKLLSKLASKALHEPVKQALNEKLQRLALQREMPEKIRKNAQLMLSKLLVLREQQDAQLVLDQYHQLQREWQNLCAEFSWLSDSEQHGFLEKHAQIEQQLTVHLGKMKERVAHQKLLEQQQQQRQQRKQHINDLLAQLHDAQSLVIAEDSGLDDVKRIVAQLEQFLQSVEAIKGYQDKVDQALSKASILINQTDRIREQLIIATRLISQLSEQKLPDSIEELLPAEQTFKDWREQWRSCSQNLGDWLPQSINEAATTISRQWQAALKPLRMQKRGQQNWFKQRFIELERLVKIGRYRAAMAVFRKIQPAYQGLTDVEQDLFSDDYQKALVSVDELKSLESFVVVPRKQAIIAKLQTLAETPLEDIKAQSEQVKEYRKRWLALGKTEGEQEGQLNQTFNRLCEQAFAPCRSYYAEQSEVRKVNYNTRLALLTSLSDLGQEIQQAEGKSLNALATQLNKLTVQWQQSGSVERDKYQQLRQQYRQIVEPMKARIREYQRESTALKEKLISQAEKALEANDFNAATKELKRLQRQWRDIGFSGPQNDAQLWQTFRAINDKAFAMRDKQIKEHKAQSEKLQNLWQSRIETLQHEIQQADAKSMQGLQRDVQSLLPEIKNQGQGFDNQNLVQKVNELRTQISKRQKTLRTQSQVKQYQHLFDVFQMIEPDTKPQQVMEEVSAFDELNNANRRAIISVFTPARAAQERNQLTLEMEILAQVDSPKQEASRRQEIQLAMLNDKLNGVSVSLEDKLHQWLACGPLPQEQRPLLARVKPLFHC
ncbi:DUF349 domain-containing protein [Thalassotalea litorea]|uniref:DUF349 domain-containing protein n=1 Tax=Thalassotalea litorea TaxID=2020715 RepID=UPI003735A330